MTFTHHDFSPGNILVTGILDFEFAGFFPNEESTNDAIVYSEDWPEAVYRVFPEELEGLGERTPLRGID